MKECVIFWITSRCNLACPECVYGVHRTVRHWDADDLYLEDCCRKLHCIPFVVISGGEPLLHPQFDAWAPKFKSMFGCRELRIETNCVFAPEHEKALSCFDSIQASRYAPEINGSQVAWLERTFPKTLQVHQNPIIHEKLSSRPGRKSCIRGTGGTMSCVMGKIYPCCVGPGIEGATGIPLTEKWQREIVSVPMPCHNCCFSDP